MHVFCWSTLGLFEITMRNVFHGSHKCRAVEDATCRIFQLAAQRLHFCVLIYVCFL